MDIQELEITQKERITELNQFIKSYRNVERRKKKILVFIIYICIVALYFFLSDLLGGTWGYILTIAIIGAGIYCISTLGFVFKTLPVSDRKLAYQACVNMEILIKIKSGTYRTDIANVLTVGSGKHLPLYNEFVKAYPELKSNKLEKLAKVQIKQNDIFSKLILL